MRRYSRQREIILNAVRENLVHPDAEEIYSIVRAKDPSISLGTVYRNLNLLSELGEIRKIQMAGGADRYDGNISGHHHSICSKCGKIMDYDYDFGGLGNEVLTQTGIECRNITVTLEGICRDCLSEK